MTHTPTPSASAPVIYTALRYCRIDHPSHDGLHTYTPECRMPRTIAEHAWDVWDDATEARHAAVHGARVLVVLSRTTERRVYGASVLPALRDAAAAVVARRTAEADRAWDSLRSASPAFRSN